MKTLKITHKNRVLYATERDGKYFPHGGGFNFKPNPQATIEEIEEIPEELQYGTVCIDGEFFITEAFWDKNNSWNGWIQPYIPVENIGIFNDGYSVTEKDGKYVYYSEYSEEELELSTRIIAGRNFIYVNTGLCFEKH